MGNPLLDLAHRIPFDRIAVEHVEPALRTLLDISQRDLDALAASPGPRTFENTLVALDRLTERLDEAFAVVRHLEGVATTPELREVFHRVEPDVMQFYTSIPLHDGLWQAIQQVKAGPLDAVELRHLRKTLDSFRRHGAELSDEGKQRLREIDRELTLATTKYSENVLDSTNAFEVLITDESQLAGLPESAIAAARQSAQSKGGDQGWRFTLQGPSYTAVLTYLDDRAVRETFYRANVTRAAQAPHDNRELVQRILDLRREKARLLGFFNFADLVLQDRMARRGEVAREFLIELSHHSRDYFDGENDELERFQRRLLGDAAPPLQPWDVGYFAEKLRLDRYDFDEEILRPYFPLDQVVKGLYELCHRLFGFRVVEPGMATEPGAAGWDPAVRCYDLIDGDGTLLGSFYTDWFPRENKRGGAWMDSFRTGGPMPAVAPLTGASTNGPLPDSPGGFRPHIGLMCGNMTPPVEGKPALLTHREVETVFHEFGHLIHHLLSRVPIRSRAGTNVAWDFVELPSQMMENWCWEKEALDLFARHWQTGEPIPAELFAKLRKARTFRAANAQMRQLGFGIADLSLHIHFDATRYHEETGGDVIQYAREVQELYSPTPLPQDHAGICSFTHLFANPVGYGAGYYSYKWAEVLDADAFSRFQKEGVFNAAIGASFRRTILEKGDSEDPSDLFRAFMGREPDQRALLVRQGLMVLG